MKPKTMETMGVAVSLIIIMCITFWIATIDKIKAYNASGSLKIQKEAVEHGYGEWYD